MLRLINRLTKQSSSFRTSDNNERSLDFKAVDMVSVVIGSYQRKNFLQKVIESIRNNGIRIPYEFIVIDGGSTDGSIEWLIQQKDIITIVQHNRGPIDGKPIRRKSWGYFMNLGFKSAQGKYIVMLSDDCLLLPEAVNKGIECYLENEKRRKKIGGIAFYFRNWPSEDNYYVQRTLGGKLMVNHGIFINTALEDVGYADEDNYMFYKADGDLCLKLWQAGYEIIDCDQSFVEHFFDENELVRKTNYEILDKDRKAYLKKWKNIYYFPKKPDLRAKKVSNFKDQSNLGEKFWGELSKGDRS